MKKLILDDLAVESFDTTRPAAKEKGTVFGEQQCTCYTVCSCPGCPTCNATCADTCAYTCDDASCLDSCEGTCAGWTCITRCVGTCLCQ
ncbi:MAG TPA: hypothetical protein VFY65_10930 [Longimicrobium sp.]|nr:hypothetical protein [Longimicrobium sp.]